MVDKTNPAEADKQTDQPGAPVAPGVTPDRGEGRRGPGGRRGHLGAGHPTRPARTPTCGQPAADVAKAIAEGVPAGAGPGGRHRAVRDPGRLPGRPGRRRAGAGRQQRGRALRHGAARPGHAEGLPEHRRHRLRRGAGALRRVGRRRGRGAPRRAGRAAHGHRERGRGRTAAGRWPCTSGSPRPSPRSRRTAWRCPLRTSTWPAGACCAARPGWRSACPPRRRSWWSTPPGSPGSARRRPRSPSPRRSSPGTCGTPSGGTSAPPARATTYAGSDATPGLGFAVPNRALELMAPWAPETGLVLA